MVAIIIIIIIKKKKTDPTVRSFSCDWLIGDSLQRLLAKW